MCNKRKHGDRDGKTEVADEEGGEKDSKVAKVDAANDQCDSSSSDDAKCSKLKRRHSDGKPAAVDEEGGEKDAKIAKVGSEENLSDPASCDGSSEDAGTSDTDGGETSGGNKGIGVEESESSSKGSGEGEDLDDGCAAKEEPMRLKVTYKKIQYEISLLPSSRIGKLKEEIEKLSGIPYSMQKLIFKGGKKLEDDNSLRESGLEANSKIMLVGSTVGDIMKVMGHASKAPLQDSPKAKPLPLCQQQKHKRVLQDGVPEDAMPGILNCDDPLPDFPLTGMLDKRKRKVRLTFQLGIDELWISTKDTTNKIAMDAIADVKSEPIEGHEEYHVVGFVLGPTEGSCYWVYWVPAQYVEAIKDAILGELGDVQESLHAAD